MTSSMLPSDIRKIPQTKCCRDSILASTAPVFLHIGAAEGLQALKPLPIPREFRAAAIAQLIEIGYYRKDPVIKLHVDNKGISLTSRSEIIPINGKATVVVPSTQAPKGL